MGSLKTSYRPVAYNNFKWNQVYGYGYKSSSIGSTRERSLIIEVDEKPYYSSVSVDWCNEYRDYIGFSKQ